MLDGQCCGMIHLAHDQDIPFVGRRPELAVAAFGARVLLYGYSRGIYSSRQLARACEERVDMMAVMGLNHPTSAPSQTSASATSSRYLTCSCRSCACAERRGSCSSDMSPLTAPS
jgi:hypothetical protein